MSKLKYEIPDMEMISFEADHMLMNGISDNGQNGSVWENPFKVSGADVLSGSFSDLWSK